jgi:pimeloyl-ACP methyl ester carboxylesterase
MNHGDNRMFQNHIFTDTDGSSIAYTTVGTGPSAIVIPGVLTVADDFRKFASELGRNFTVHVLERRGRGRSEPQGADYSMADEFKDVHELQARTQSAYLFGHSYGGHIALQVARENQGIKKVAVYEPCLSVDGSISMAWATRYERLLAEGKRLDAFVEFCKGAGPNSARATPRWLLKLLMPMMLGNDELHTRLKLLETNLNEHLEIVRRDNVHRELAQIPVPVLLMTGGRSELPWVEIVVRKLSALIPHIRVERFSRLDHFGPDKTGPDEVARSVTAFFFSS